jgi:thiamine pyrophosphokinase
VSCDAGLRGASRAQPELPDPGHAGGGNILLSINHPPPSEDFSLQRNVQRIIIFANGELPDIDKARFLMQKDDYIICADGGTRHARSLGITPDLIIGDLDSVQQEAIQKFKENGVRVETYSHDKNETDLELAIHRALELIPQQIVILRLDDGVEEVLLCRDQAQVHGQSGDIVSLIPWQGAVSEIQTTNLKWVLSKETLYPDKTRGISNEMTGDIASVSIGSGLLLIVHRRLS